MKLIKNFGAKVRAKCYFVQLEINNCLNWHMKRLILLVLEKKSILNQMDQNIHVIILEQKREPKAIFWRQEKAMG